MIKVAVRKDVQRLIELKDKAKTTRDLRVYLDRMEDREIGREDVLSIGDFHECYGVWFAGGLWRALKEVVQDGYRTVFCTVPPGKLSEGVHDVYCGGRETRLYFWMAQGYPRGLVVWADDVEANNIAARLLEERPWSWQECFV